ncbi:MAG: phospholipid carrier-dependent glycosyltransferase, partial [Pyrinomonadaceae bacterium]
MFGTRAAVFSVALFSVEPTVLAHGRTALNDLPAAFGYLLFFFTLHAYLKTPDLPHALGLGLASGLAIVTKFSLIVLGPVFIGVVIFSIWTAPRRNELRARVSARMALAVFAAMLVINGVYYFQHRPPEEAEFR